MSKYTTQLRYIYENNPQEVIDTFSSYNLEDYLTNAQIDVLLKAGNWTKLKLANKIINNYYFREIGSETWSMFKHYAIIEMQKLMEHYLPLIYSRAIDYDPLINVDYTEEYHSTSTGANDSKGASSSNSKSESSGNSKFSDTPSVGLQNIKEGKYLTNANFNDIGSKVEDEINSTNTSTNKSNQEYTKTIRGNSGVSATAQRMIEQFRDNIIAIDSKIIAELNPLFMSLY